MLLAGASRAVVPRPDRPERSGRRRWGRGQRGAAGGRLRRTAACPAMPCRIGGRCPRAGAARAGGRASREEHAPAEQDAADREAGDNAVPRAPGPRTAVGQAPCVQHAVVTAGGTARFRGAGHDHASARPRPGHDRESAGPAQGPVRRVRRRSGADEARDRMGRFVHSWHRLRDRPGRPLLARSVTDDLPAAPAPTAWRALVAADTWVRISMQ